MNNRLLRRLNYSLFHSATLIGLFLLAGCGGDNPSDTETDPGAASICSADYLAKHSRVSTASYLSNEDDIAENKYIQLKAVLDKYRGLQADMKDLENAPRCKRSASDLSALNPKFEYDIQSKKGLIENAIQKFEPRVQFALIIKNLDDKTGILFRDASAENEIAPGYLEHLFDLYHYEVAGKSPSISSTYNAVAEYLSKLRVLSRKFPNFKYTSYGPAKGNGQEGRNYYYADKRCSIDTYEKRAQAFLNLLVRNAHSYSPFTEFLHGEQARRNQAEREEQERTQRERQAENKRREDAEKARIQREKLEREAREEQERQAERIRRQNDEYRKQREEEERQAREAKILEEEVIFQSFQTTPVEQFLTASSYMDGIPSLGEINPETQGKWLQHLGNRRAQEGFLQLHPTIAEIEAMIRKIGITTPAQVTAVIDLKRLAIHTPGLVTDGAFLTSLLSEIIPNGFNFSQTYRTSNKNLVITEGLPGIWNLAPKVPDIANLIRLIGISTKQDVDTVMDLKRKSFFEHGIVHNGPDYETLCNEIIARGFQTSPEYFDQNVLFVLSTYERFIINTRTLTRQDFNILRRFILSPVIPEEYQNTARNYVTDLINNQLIDLPVRMRALVIVQFKEMLLNLFNEVNPDVTQSIRYYLIRPEALAAGVLHNHVNTGESFMELGRSFSDEDPGTKCKEHAEVDSVPYHIGNIAPEGEESNSDLWRHVRGLGGEGKFPIHCGANSKTKRHELPLTDEMLARAGFDAAAIFDWKISTLLSYYRELLRIQRGEPEEDSKSDSGSELGEGAEETPPAGKPAGEEGRVDYRVCPTPDCGIPLFAHHKDGHGHVRCNVCDQNKCFSCQHEHVGMTCKQFEQNKEAPEYRDPNSKLRECPYCGAPAAKDDRCTSVNCALCGQEYNFIKGAPRERTNFSDLHKYTPVINEATQERAVPRREYRVEGDADWVPGRGMESAYPESEGPIKNAHKIRTGAARYQR